MYTSYLDSLEACDALDDLHQKREYGFQQTDDI